MQAQLKAKELREAASLLVERATPLSRRVVRRLSERYPAVMRLRQSYWRYVSAGDDARA